MTEEHPLGAVSDYDDLVQLPPKERTRLSRLRDCLAARVWMPSEALAVLCGFHPELGQYNDAAGMAFLPGADDFYGVRFGARQPDDLRELDAGLEEQRGYVRGLHMTTMPPVEAIAKAVASGITIPWLKVAREDAECRKYLPLEALDTSADAPRVPLVAKEVASLGGKAKRDNDRQRSKWLPRVEKLLAEDWKPAEILAAFETEDDAPPRSTLFGWCKKIKERGGSS